MDMRFFANDSLIIWEVFRKKTFLTPTPGRALDGPEGPRVGQKTAKIELK